MTGLPPWKMSESRNFMGSEAQCCRKPIHNSWDETARKFGELEHNLWNRAGNRGAAVRQSDSHPWESPADVAFFLAAEIGL